MWWRCNGNKNRNNSCKLQCNRIYASCTSSFTAFSSGFLCHLAIKTGIPSKLLTGCGCCLREEKKHTSQHKCFFSSNESVLRRCEELVFTTKASVSCYSRTHCKNDVRNMSCFIYTVYKKNLSSMYFLCTLNHKSKLVETETEQKKSGCQI